MVLSFQSRYWRRWRIARRLLFSLPTAVISNRKTAADNKRPRCLQSPFYIRFSWLTWGEYLFLATYLLVPLIILLILQYTSHHISPHLAFLTHIANTLTLAHHAILYVCVLLFCSAAAYLFRYALTIKSEIHAPLIGCVGHILCAACSTYFILLGENDLLFASLSTKLHFSLRCTLVITALFIALFTARMLLCTIGSTFYLANHLEEEMDVKQVLPFRFVSGPVPRTTHTNLLPKAVYAFWRQGYLHTYGAWLGGPFTVGPRGGPQTPKQHNLDYISIDAAQCDPLHDVLHGKGGLADRCRAAGIQLQLLSHSPLYHSFDQFIHDINDNIWIRDNWKYSLVCHIVPQSVLEKILTLCIHMEQETQSLSQLYEHMKSTLSLFWMEGQYSNHAQVRLGEAYMGRQNAIVCIMAGLLTRCLIHEMVTGLISGATVLCTLDQYDPEKAFILDDFIVRQYLNVQKGNAESDGPDVQATYRP